MAIDTVKKRREAVASRRLPLIRRILLAPNSDLDAADRASLTGTYLIEVDAGIDYPDSVLVGDP